MSTRKSIKEDELLIEKRIRAGIIDLILIAMISGYLRVMIDFILKYYFAVDWFSVTPILDLFIEIIIFTFMTLLEVLIFSGGSVGKKAMNLEIRSKNGKKISMIRICFRRFLTLRLWYLNIIFYIIVDQTLCDILFNTEVVEKQVTDN